MYDDDFYRVCWFRAEQEVARHVFGDLVQARRFAQDRLQIQKIRKGANRARVVDADGVTYFVFEA